MNVKRERSRCHRARGCTIGAANDNRPHRLVVIRRHFSMLTGATATQKEKYKNNKSNIYTNDAFKTEKSTTKAKSEKIIVK